MASARAKTIEAKVFQIFRRETIDGRRPHLIARDVYLLMGNVALGSVYIALKALRRKGIIRFALGSFRNMELAPGAPERLDDGRGMSLGSAAALRAFGPQKRNNRASMATAKPVRGRRIVTE